MGKRGPAKTPTEVLKGRGSWRGDDRDDEPVAPAEPPVRPAWLSELEARIWDETVPRLDGMRILSCADEALLASYCIEYAAVQECKEIIAREGRMVETHKGLVKHPAQLALENAMDKLIKLAREFGLSPASRANVSTEKAPKSGTTGKFIGGLSRTG